MPQVVKGVLKEWRKVHLGRFKAADTVNLVFPNEYGPLRSYTGFKKQFEMFFKEKGSAQITFHQLRHTFATKMIERGVNPRVVQEYLGYKDISTTLVIYTGVTSAVMKEAADSADEAMRGGVIVCGNEWDIIVDDILALLTSPKSGISGLNQVQS